MLRWPVRVAQGAAVLAADALLFAYEFWNAWKVPCLHELTLHLIALWEYVKNDDPAAMSGESRQTSTVVMCLAERRCASRGIEVTDGCDELARDDSIANVDHDRAVNFSRQLSLTFA